MEKINSLKEIAIDLKLESLVKELDKLYEEVNAEQLQLFIPLVGEYSSGKTTLLNSLSDAKVLETATKPTTATIFEMHYSQDRNAAFVTDINGETKEVSIDELYNEKLDESKVVTVMDTSKKVSASTILVDTPGLSSPDLRHKQSLMEFLPYSDAVILVTDINQQLTKSLADFVEMMKLTDRPLYLIITKTDTKAENEIEEAKKYIVDNIDLPLKSVESVSAINDDLSGIQKILSEINAEKKDIRSNSINIRLNRISEAMIEYIDQLLQSTYDNRELDKDILSQQRRLEEIRYLIYKLIRESNREIDSIGSDFVHDYRHAVNRKLESIVLSNHVDYDRIAFSEIKNIDTVTLSNYMNKVRSYLIKASQTGDNAIPMAALADIDLSGYSLGELAYGLDLNSLGHEKDAQIESGIKIGAIAVLAIGAAYLGTAAATSSKVATAVPTTALTLGTVFEGADMVLDASSMVSNKKLSRKLSAKQTINNWEENISESNRKVERVLTEAEQKGFSLSGIVKNITDNKYGKPQRQRAINEFIQDTLMPRFESEIQRIKTMIVSEIRALLEANAKESIQSQQAKISELLEAQKSGKEAFEEQMNRLSEYKKYLQSINNEN